MERCKYLLPCGRCDKRGAPCDATIKGLEAYNSMKSPKCECKHKWIERLEKTDLHNGCGESYYIQRKYCVECGVIEERMYTLTELTYLANT